MHGHVLAAVVLALPLVWAAPASAERRADELELQLRDVTFAWYQPSKDFGWKEYSVVKGIAYSRAPYFLFSPQPTKRVRVEYKNSPNGQWKQAGTTSATEMSPEFEFPVGDGEGWWRLHYPGDAYHNEQYSPALRLYRTARFTGIKTNRKTASPGQAIVLSGRLVRRVGTSDGGSKDAGGWGGRRVAVAYTCGKNGTQIYDLGRRRTNAKGYFSASTTFKCTGGFGASAYGSVFSTLSTFVRVKRR
ncbi:hypothetical protein EDD29_4958 [Actinocorallia herbida]|uniref:Polysaccharide lyase-like protein n=1 Tax=Actinocorallia herbida TaxID=58109 RepID=A0A3N1D2R0_9ACTN|nr:hypothetical protein [Actinocorallia herbida]ROO87358.1 hypothetical protein EDD29_4958 [Actinocorallia herbida]